MATTDQILSRLRKTLLPIFGVGDIQLKDNTGVAEIRDNTDSAYADLALNQVQVHGDNAANAVILDAPAALGSDLTLVLPATDGSDGDVLTTDGSGNLSFETPVSNSIQMVSKQFTQADGASFALFTPLAGTVILEVAVRVDVNASSSGPAPKLAVGTVADDEAYMLFNDNNIEQLSTFLRVQHTDVIGSPDAIIGTVTNTAAKSFTATVFIKYAVPTSV